jgi:hypothetical protein
MHMSVLSELISKCESEGKCPLLKSFSASGGSAAAGWRKKIHLQGLRPPTTLPKQFLGNEQLTNDNHYPSSFVLGQRRSTARKL